ncbi:hypothetical protein Bca52824_036934 [Brassica carinata]|uniref:Senescence-associated carboxylesterase 101 n=1 Tax=Brassica carinata TaxID=52824 RepID=A0A8X7S6A7_BRACI|nr:hypothetical protein Bca52824_036934 [Brassica carinata]
MWTLTKVPCPGYRNCTELGKLVLSSGLLNTSWSKISEIHESNLQSKDPPLEFQVYKEAKFVFVVFAAPPVCIDAFSNCGSTLVPNPESQDANLFSFLCSKKTPSFSLHTTALQLFASVAKNKSLTDLKTELLESTKPVIITGAALGGSIASLFTLWLLEKVEPELKRPLCITFGSPFIGDANLQQILENSVRNSCFLHVADATQTPIAKGFEPFGTYLICNESGCVCIEDPKAVMGLLLGGNTSLEGWRDYGEVLKSFDRFSMAEARVMVGDVIINGIKKRAEKKKNQRFDQLKRLDEVKISMAYMEWYKKDSKKAKIVYYDRFKNQPAAFVYEIRRRVMNNYWDTMVQEVEKMPQGEESYLKKRCLLSGNNYRRLMEPLDIAKYYHEGNKEYITTGRSHHYVMLEKWFKQSKLNEPLRGTGTDLSELLTFDSCFWSEVEEALIVIKCLNTQEGEREGLVSKLVGFEDYVWEIIRKREVSPEIFLEKSSFMTWWKEYKEIKGTRDGFGSSPSHFIEFMNTGKYKTYGKPDSNSSG